MITPRSTKKINSYKEERIRSARKGLSESISFGKDLEELESVMKLSISRRSSGGLNTMRLSLQRELSESFSLKSPSNLESSLRLSNVNDKFISKYMDKASNIIEVSEEEPVSNVLAEKSVSSNILLKPKKKVVEALRKDPKLEKCLPSSVKVLGKMTESRLIQKAIKKRGKILLK